MNLVTKPVSENKWIPCPYCGGLRVIHTIKAESGKVESQPCRHCYPDGRVQLTRK